MLQKVFKDHKKWINTTKKMGCNQQEAEDIVADMYLIIGKMLKKGLDISYGDEVNYYYIYRTLKTSFLQLKNKQTKASKVPLELTYELAESEQIDFNNANNIMQDELDNQYWYDRKVFELIQSGISFTELSNKTKISYHSLYNTYRKTKEKLVNKILE